MPAVTAKGLGINWEENDVDGKTGEECQNSGKILLSVAIELSSPVNSSVKVSVSYKRKRGEGKKSK